MKVTLIASTRVHDADIAAAMGGLTAGGDAGLSTDGEFLIEASGRACYQSFHRPNPATAKTRDYIRKNILGKGHGSVLEHASATFYITGVSRSLTHELIRHRAGTAYSELSQRYVDMAEVEFVLPPAMRDVGGPIHEADDLAELAKAWNDTGFFAAVRELYDDVIDAMRGDGVTGKRAREAARAVMPNATETKIVMTANYRAWRHIIRMRGSEHADAEIRELAIEILEQLYDEAPSVFGDFSIVTLADGRQVIE